MCKALGLDPNKVSRFVFEADAGTNIVSVVVTMPAILSDEGDQLVEEIRKYVLSGGGLVDDDAA